MFRYSSTGTSTLRYHTQQTAVPSNAILNLLRLPCSLQLLCHASQQCGAKKHTNEGHGANLPSSITISSSTQFILKLSPTSSITPLSTHLTTWMTMVWLPTSLFCVNDHITLTRQNTDLQKIRQARMQELAQQGQGQGGNDKKYYSMNFSP